MTTPLGYTPQKGKVILSKGADWVCTLQAQGQTWPTGTTVSITFLTATPVTASATVTESTATAAFVIQSATVDPIPSQTGFRIYYMLPGSPTTEYAWFVGKVQRVE